MLGLDEHERVIDTKGKNDKISRIPLMSAVCKKDMTTLIINEMRLVNPDA